MESALGVGSQHPAAVQVAAAEFILEGLYAQRRISRSEQRGFVAEDVKRPPVQEPARPVRNPRQRFN
jgi:magnesium chelatase subunit I